MVSFSHLTHGISTVLAQNDQRMVEFVSTLRTVLPEAENHLGRQAATQDERLHAMLNEAVRTERAHMKASRHPALVLGTTSGLPRVSSSGLRAVSSIRSDISSATNQRRESVRRQYDRMNRWSTNYQARRSRLQLFYRLLDTVHRALVCLHPAFDTNRFHCTAESRAY